MPIQPISPYATALAGANAVQLLRDPVDPIGAAARALDNLRPVITTQAAVVQFGERAVSLARSSVTPNADATALDVFDTNEANSALRPATANDTEELLANTLGPNETDAALIDTLNTNSALLRTPGGLEADSELFSNQRPSPLESGFFNSPNATNTESTLARLARDGGLESTFPRAPVDGTLESTFPQALRNDALESTFPRVPGNTTEAGFFRSTTTTESGFFRTNDATTANGLESQFPLAPGANDLVTNPRLSLAENAQATLLRSPAELAAQQADEASLFRSPAELAAENSLLRSPAELAAQQAEEASLFRSPAQLATQQAEESSLFRSPADLAAENSLLRSPAELAAQRAEDNSLLRSPAELAAQRAEETSLFRTLENNPAENSAATQFRPDELNIDQQREVRDLAQTARQVEADAQAQRSAAGGYASGVQLRYEIGPDGRRYAVEGEVSMDLSPVQGDPAATLRKMEVIRDAALSGNASVNDQSAAAEAERLARQARAELAAQRYAEAQGL